MLSAKEIKINGHILTVKNNTLYINGVVASHSEDGGNFLTKDEALDFFTKKDDKTDTDQFLKSKDIESIMENIVNEVHNKLKNSLNDSFKDIYEFKNDLRKSKVFERLSEEYSVFELIEAIINAFSGKPQKLNEIKNRVSSIESDLKGFPKIK